MTKTYEDESALIQEDASALLVGKNYDAVVTARKVRKFVLVKHTTPDVRLHHCPETEQYLTFGQILPQLEKLELLMSLLI